MYSSIPVVLASGVAGGLVTPLWYIAFKDVHARLVPADSRQIVDFRTAPVSSKLLDFGRGFVVAGVLAYPAHAGGVTTLTDSIRLALVLWLGFPLIMLMAPVIWGGESWRIAALHAGDWLIKLLVMTVIVGVWS